MAFKKRTTRDVRFALIAIDAYRTIPLETEIWIRGGDDCWKRALSLALLLKSGAGGRIKEMEADILAAFNETNNDDGYLALWLADLLSDNRLGYEHSLAIANKLETMAVQFDAAGDLHRSRDSFQAASENYKLVGDKSKAAEMTAALAEGWVKEAIARISSEQPSYMVAVSFYENAIQTYRTIPKVERAAYKVNDRIAELRNKLDDAGNKSLDEMGVINSPGVDISQMIKGACESVQGKSVIEALRGFANIYRGIDAKGLRESALERMQKNPFQALFPATMMSEDGRVIAKRPGMSLNGSMTNEDEIAIRVEMIRDYGIEIGLVVQGSIVPALDAILLEHRLCERDFVSLASESPIVPKGRERLFGKALFAGYERDFGTALHLLIPQIENIVRIQIKQAGGKTTTLDSNGIQNENGLSTLMNLPEAENIFGENLGFEINTLLCDSFGPNFRNELAHGLLDDASCQSINAVYIWWLGLRLIFNTFWSAARKNSEADEEDES